MLTELGVASNAPLMLKSQALHLLSGYNQPPPLLRIVVPYIPVPETNGEEWDRLEPRRCIDLLISTAVDGEYAGYGTVPPITKESMELRGVSLGVFDVSGIKI
jgi:intracellular protein transport protein USO1